jgi:hypothetical protein
VHARSFFLVVKYIDMTTNIKGLTISLILIAVFGFVVFYFTKNNTEAPVDQIPDSTTKEVDPNTMIDVVSPVPYGMVTSPVSVIGQAKGTWYFEASFPVTLIDANGKVIVQTHAEAQGDWMTENFVPFLATLNFSKPATKTGTLILEKDNPSGLPEHDAKVEIPVTFSN